MSDLSKSFEDEIFKVPYSFTPSPASEVGLSLYDLLDGPKTAKSGLEVAPANPSPSLESEGGASDRRHLWPMFRDLIAECRPATIFGEQVASKDGRGWLAGVRTDLEALGYRVGAADLCSAGVGSPNIRQRLYWVADSQHKQHQGSLRGPIVDRRTQGSGSPIESTGYSATSGLAGGESQHPRGLPIGTEEEHAESGNRSVWSYFRVVRCTDGNSRRVGRGVSPLAYGVPRDLGQGQPWFRPVRRGASRNRTGRLKGYGNAINPVVAAEFIRAYLETEK